ncbi:MAG: ABC transporter permease [Lachnospiraceae bacterium]|nr:ABC transporter permease [Lachnospiraceae bacterium]
MRGFFGLVRRNLLMYFKDISAVIFSLLTSIIVFVLYLLFLKGNYVSSIESYAKGLDTFIKDGDIDMLVTGILLVGILGSALITVPYSTIMGIVRDKETGVSDDILVTPLKRRLIAAAYFISAAICSFIMVSFIATVSFILVGIRGNLHMAPGAILATYGIILLGSVSSTSLFMLVVTGFKSSAACNAFFGILSAAAGFVIGAFIPISGFSTTVQTICCLFPASHVTVLLRHSLLNGILEKINTDIGGVDGGAFASAIKETFTFELPFMGKALTPFNSMTIACACVVVFSVLCMFVYSKTYKRK